MTPSAREVLVTDGHWRKTLAAVRGLGRHAIPTIVGESTWFSMASFSRFCCRRVVYPSPMQNPEGFLDRLADLCRSNPIRMLLPMEDLSVRLLSAHRAAFDRLTYLPLPDHASIMRAFDKAETLTLADALGIPTPRTWRIRHLSELQTLKRRLPYPVVIKPRTGSGAIGVCYPDNSRQLERQYRYIHRHFPFPLIQERLPKDGPGYGASLLFDEKTNVKACFVHKRLREYPITGGASTLRISTRQDTILEMARTLMTSLDWFGVCMVEFKLDPRDQTPKLMEINPRFWGSLALPIAAGVNFPYLLYRLAMGQRFASIEKYPIGVSCRWLIPGDLLHFLASSHKRSLGWRFFDLRNNGAHFDILSRRDPLPALIKILSPLTFLYDPDMKRRLKQRKYILQ